MALSSAHTSQTNAQATVGALLRQLRVSVTSQTIRQTLWQHPDFPSLLSISDALDDWQVDNAAIQLGHVEQLRELPTPFVVHSTKEGGLYLLIESVANGTITSMEPNRQHRQTEPEAQFAKHWSGVVLMAEKTEQSGELDYQRKHRQEVIENLRWPSVLMGAYCGRDFADPWPKSQPGRLVLVIDQINGLGTEFVIGTKATRPCQRPHRQTLQRNRKNGMRRRVKRPGSHAGRYSALD